MDYIICIIGIKTHFNNTEKLGEHGRFSRAYTTSPAFEVNVPHLTEALRRDKREELLGSKILYIAEPVPADINVAQEINWIADEPFAYGKFTLQAKGAKSVSINFSDFLLPKGTEMFIYNNTNCNYKIAQSYFIILQWLMPI